MSSPALPADAVITACKVVDDEGRTWTRLPEAWREGATLCQATRTYAYPDGRYLASCRYRSAWAAGELGLCGTHFAALLDLGQ